MEPALDSLENLATAMLAGSVALFQWFLAKFFETVSSTDSLGLPFDRLLLAFLGAYLTLPLMLIAHLAASDSNFRWTRVTSYVGVALLLAVFAARLTDTAGIAILGIATIGIAIVHFRSLEDSRARKAEVVKAERQATRVWKTVYNRGITRTGLALSYATIAFVALGALVTVLSPNEAKRYFRPCAPADSSSTPPRVGEYQRPANTPADSLALCLFTQLRDSLARRDVAPDVRRALALLERSDSLLVLANRLGWRSDLDSVGIAAMRDARTIPHVRVQLAASCDSMRITARLLRIDAARHVRQAATHVGTSKDSALARGLRVASPVPTAIIRGQGVSDSVLAKCSNALAAADTATREAAAWTEHRRDLFAAWLRVQWSRSINSARQVMLSAYLAALVLLGVWIATTRIYTKARVQRQLGTLVATMLFFVPLLPGVRPGDIPLRDPARLFDFPQWRASATVAAKQAGRPNERTPDEQPVVADSSRAIAVQMQDSTIKAMRERLDDLKNVLKSADSVTKATLGRLE